MQLNHRTSITEIFIVHHFISPFVNKIIHPEESPRTESLPCFTSSYSLHPSLLAFVQKYHVLLLSVALTGFLRTKKTTMLLLLFLESITRGLMTRKVDEIVQKKSAVRVFKMLSITSRRHHYGGHTYEVKEYQDSSWENICSKEFKFHTQRRENSDGSEHSTRLWKIFSSYIAVFSSDAVLGKDFFRLLGFKCLTRNEPFHHDLDKQFFMFHFFRQIIIPRSKGRIFFFSVSFFLFLIMAKKYRITKT